MDFKYNLEFTDDCKNEILEIYEYISQNLASTEAAKKLMKKIKVVTYPNPSENINTDNAYSIPHIKRTQKVLSINLYPL